MSDPTLQTFYGVCLTVLTGIVTAVGGFVIRYINRRTDALDREETRTAAFDAGMLVEERTRKGSVPPSEKLELAVKLANEATPDRIKVQPRDVEAQLPRVRASLPASSIMPLPLPVTFSSSVPPDDPERVTLPRPAPLPRDPSREKAPLR